METVVLETKDSMGKELWISRDENGVPVLYCLDCNFHSLGGRDFIELPRFYRTERGARQAAARLTGDKLVWKAPDLTTTGEIVIKDAEQDVFAQAAAQMGKACPPLVQTFTQDKAELERLYPKGGEGKSSLPRKSKYGNGAPPPAPIVGAKPVEAPGRPGSQ